MSEPRTRRTQLQGLYARTRALPVCLRKKVDRPRLRLRGRSGEASCHEGDGSEARDPAARPRSCGCGGRLLGGAPLHSCLASGAVQVGLTVGAMSEKVK